MYFALPTDTGTMREAGLFVSPVVEARYLTGII